DRPWQELPDPAVDFGEEQEYRHYVLHRALELIQKEFSPLHARAFQEYVLSGQPVDEVARALELSPGTIYSIKSRILNRLGRSCASCWIDSRSTIRPIGTRLRRPRQSCWAGC